MWAQASAVALHLIAAISISNETADLLYACDPLQI